MSKREIEPAWTLQEVMRYFNIRDSRTVTERYIKQQGLKFYRSGNEYRFRAKDVYEFEESLKEIARQEILSRIPIKPKRKCHAPKIDFEKKRINLEELRVI